MAEKQEQACIIFRKPLKDKNTRRRTDGEDEYTPSSIAHLIAIGVSSTIGAGVYILVGTVARGHSGPALAFFFLIAGIAAALSAFCYAELASRCPSARSYFSSLRGYSENTIHDPSIVCDNVLKRPSHSPNFNR